MPNDPNELGKMQGNGLPTASGQYLVAINDDATSEYYPEFQVAYFEESPPSWSTEIYQPDHGTMEPTDITRDVTRWWHLPSE